MEGGRGMARKKWAEKGKWGRENLKEKQRFNSPPRRSAVDDSGAREREGLKCHTVSLSTE